MRRRIIGLLVVGLATLCGVIGYRWWTRPVPHDLKVATAKPGGTFYRLGRQVSGVLALSSSPWIRSAEPVESAGTPASLKMLAEGKVQLALAMQHELSGHTGVAAIARLYSDMVQVLRVVDDERAWLADPTRWPAQAARVFVGGPESGTRRLAVPLLRALCGTTDGLRVMPHTTYAEAAEALVRGEIDVAVFAAGTPTPAASFALARGGVRLVPLTSEAVRKQAESLRLTERQIPADTYAGQTEEVSTFGSEVFLVGRASLANGLVDDLLDSLFGNLDELLEAHTTAHDIRLTDAFPAPRGVAWHPAALAYKTSRDLRIATGPLRGRYYQAGRISRDLLKVRRIPSKVLQTDGSLNNAELLADNPRTLGVMQYDIALAARFGQLGPVYSTLREGYRPAGVSVHAVPDLQRICVLHKERVHVIARRAALADRDISAATLDDLRVTDPEARKPRICLGAIGGGSRVAAAAVLMAHDFDLERDVEIVYRSVPAMIAGLQSGVLDAAILVSYTPSDALRAALDSNELALLSLAANARRHLMTTAFEADTISPGSYGCLPRDWQPVRTIATPAVLVVSGSMSERDAYRVTKAHFEGEALVGVQGGAKAMARRLASLPLHPGAARYYREAGHLPTPEKTNWLELIGQIAALLAVGAGVHRGALMLRRDMVKAAYARRILRVCTEGAAARSVRDLQALRDEVLERARRPWWQLRGLNKAHWVALTELIDARMAEAMDNKTRHYVAAIREIARNDDLSQTARVARYDELKRHIWRQFEWGEIDGDHHSILLGVLDQSLRETWWRLPTEADENHDRHTERGHAPAGGRSGKRRRRRRRRGRRGD